jgi:hypothetical protein
MKPGMTIVPAQSTTSASPAENAWPHLRDARAVDQHVGVLEIADLRVERQHHAAAQQDARFRPSPTMFCGDDDVAAGAPPVWVGAHDAAASPAAVAVAVRNSRRDAPTHVRVVDMGALSVGTHVHDMGPLSVGAP